MVWKFVDLMFSQTSLTIVSTNTIGIEDKSASPSLHKHLKLNMSLKHFFTLGHAKIVQLKSLSKLWISHNFPNVSYYICFLCLSLNFIRTIVAYLHLHESMVNNIGNCYISYYNNIHTKNSHHMKLCKYVHLLAH